MFEWEFSEIVGEWKGYRVGSVRRVVGEAGRESVHIELLGGEALMQCSGCQAWVERVHETTRRWVRDLPILGAQTHLLVYRRRVKCVRCGPKLEALSWLTAYGRVTRRLAESVARLCKVLPVKHVAEHYGLGWDTVKAIDKAFLHEELGPVDFSGVELLAMDEFALHKGHRYATVVVDAPRKRVLWVGRGRGRDDVRPFFRLLGEQGCQQIRAVAIDMNAAYELEVRAHCQHAEVIYDLFHVVAKYGREVIDRVRVDEANRLRQDRTARQVVKGSRWLLLRNRENQSRDERVRLQELLDANRALMTVYILKDDLKHLWSYRYRAAAVKFWKAWYARAVRSRIKPLVRFAKRLKPYLQGIFAHCRYPLNTSLIEGINNKIKVIKRMAYGFRDDDYFFLKIRAAFPGIPG